MGNNYCKELGVSGNRPVGTTVFNALWEKYDPAKGNINSDAAARKFVTDFAAAAGVSVDAKAVDKVLTDLNVMETGLSYEKFKQLFVTTLGTQIQMKESLMWSVNPKKMVKEKGKEEGERKLTIIFQHVFEESNTGGSCSHCHGAVLRKAMKCVHCAGVVHKKCIPFLQAQCVYREGDPTEAKKIIYEALGPTQLPLPPAPNHVQQVILSLSGAEITVHLGDLVPQQIVASGNHFAIVSKEGDLILYSVKDKAVSEPQRLYVPDKVSNVSIGGSTLAVVTTTGALLLASLLDSPVALSSTHITEKASKVSVSGDYLAVAVGNKLVTMPTLLIKKPLPGLVPLLPFTELNAVNSGISQLSASSKHFVILANDGEVYCMGDNFDQAVVHEGASTLNLPIKPFVAKAASCIATSERVSFCIDGSGVLWGWGDDQQQLLPPTSKNPKKPINIVGLPKLSGIACSFKTAVVVTQQGQVFGWGANKQGQLHGMQQQIIEAPTPLSIRSFVIAAAVGDEFLVLLVSKPPSQSLAGISLRNEPPKSTQPVRLPEAIPNVEQPLAPTLSTSAPSSDKKLAHREHHHHHHKHKDQAAKVKDQAAPQSGHAYIVGSGVAGLAAAVFLIEDAKWNPRNIHILEQDNIEGGCLDGGGTNSEGFLVRGGRMFDEHYNCTYHFLKSVPSLELKGKSLYDDYLLYNEEVKWDCKFRLMEGGKAVDATKMGLRLKDVNRFGELLLAPEDLLKGIRIEGWFKPKFFKSNFWFMWSTTFAFQTWHSVIELRRYFLRFYTLLPELHSLSCTRRTRYNQYASMIAPTTQWLKEKEVDFQRNTIVTDVQFGHVGTPEEDFRAATHISLEHGSTAASITLEPSDIVFISIGSMVADSRCGDSNTPPELVEHPISGSWKLWASIGKTQPDFGFPEHYYNHVMESKWESFTVTLRDDIFAKRVADITQNPLGTGGLMTFKDSNWMMTICVAHWPHFPSGFGDQLPDVNMFWGYGLYGDKEGNFIKKRMCDCTGKELLQEALFHLHMFSDQEMAEISGKALVIPCMMPFITSQFLLREPHKDRPAVVPRGAKNFAFLGQYTEIDDDVVFTVEYSVRSAMMAVKALAAPSLEVPKVFIHHSVAEFVKNLETLLHH